MEWDSIDITRLGDKYYHTGGFVYNPDYSLTKPYSLTITNEQLQKMYGVDTLIKKSEIKKSEKKENAKMNLKVNSSTNPMKYVVSCNDWKDLSIENILVTLSALKGKLMYEISPMKIKELQCEMTLPVKNRLIEAGKRLRRYGKFSPIIPSFDEYGNRLPDQIEIEGSKGVIIKIIDSPISDSEDYLALKAITFYDLDDLPF